MDGGGTVAKSRPGRRPSAKPQAKRPQNAQLNTQKRRVLTQHYRAKYGVK
jgi:hypothetical protein